MFPVYCSEKQKKMFFDILSGGIKRIIHLKLEKKGSIIFSLFLCILVNQFTIAGFGKVWWLTRAKLIFHGQGHVKRVPEKVALNIKERELALIMKYYTSLFLPVRGFIAAIHRHKENKTLFAFSFRFCCCTREHFKQFFLRMITHSGSQCKQVCCFSDD